MLKVNKKTLKRTGLSNDMGDIQEERVKYLEKLKKVDFKGIKESLECIKEADKVVFAGRGRSGYAAEIGQWFFSDLGKETSFYNGPDHPRKEEFEKKNIVLLAISGSGETSEIVQTARDYNNQEARVMSITASLDSSLSELSDLVIEVKKGREEQIEGSYIERQIIRPDTPTMGDESEEMSLLTLYLMGKKLENPGLEVKKEAEAEVENLKRVFEEKEESYLEVKKALNDYWNTGVYLIGLGKSETVCKMVSNRAQHYGMEIYCTGNSTNPPIKPQNLAVIVSGSGSAGGIHKNNIKKIKEQSTGLGGQSNRAVIAAVVGGENGIEGESDESLSLGGANPCGTDPTIDEMGELEPFYFRTPVVFNMMLREIAEERGITEKLAEDKHVNI